MAGSPVSKGDHCNSKIVTYPPEWEDKERMSYLLAPFPPSDKPLGLDDPKLAFWSSFILSSSKELRKFVMSERVLQERFRWKGQSNVGCLSVVLESMEKTGQVTKLADFYTVEQSWLSWGASIVKKPVTWALRSYLQASKYEGEYVISCVAKECAETVLSRHQSSVLYKSTDNVMRKEDFEQLCVESVSLEEIPVIAQQLTHSGHLVKAGTEFGYEVVKLSPNQAKVTDVDIGIVRIKETIVNLSAQIKMLEEAIARFRQSAKDMVKGKDKKGALRALRHSKAKKALLDSKEAMLDNVQDILHKIQGAETDAMVFAAYKSGVEALGFLRNSQGLTLEAAEDLRADMNELAEEGEEIAAVLGEGQAGDMGDDEELLRELEGLMGPELEVDQLGLNMAKLSVKEEGEEGNLLEHLEHLPPVPTGAMPIPTGVTCTGAPTGVTGTPTTGVMSTSSTTNKTKKKDRNIPQLAS